MSQISIHENSVKSKFIDNLELKIQVVNEIPALIMYKYIIQSLKFFKI